MEYINLQNQTIKYTKLFIISLAKEMELFRVFDSMTFTDTTADKFESSLNVRGELDPQETRRLMFLSSTFSVMLWAIDVTKQNIVLAILRPPKLPSDLRPHMLSAMKDMHKSSSFQPPGALGAGGLDRNDGTVPGAVVPAAKRKAAAPKKPAGVKKQVNSKIQICSSKLTDIKCWNTKVESSPLHLDCKKNKLYNHIANHTSCVQMILDKTG